MKAFQILLWVVCGIGLVLTIGIVGGVENGQALTNLWWCIPCMLTSLVAGFVARG